MSALPLRIEAVRVRDLPGYAAQAAARHDGGLVPISPERALSHSRNPAASGDEVGLIAAYRDGRCVGYMGLVPGRLWDGAALRQVFWMSTWLVAPELRGTGAGYQILSAVLELGYDLFGTMFTASAGRVLRGAGFTDFGPLEYTELNFRKAAPWAEATRALRRTLRNQATGWGARAARLDAAAAWPAKALVQRLLARRYACFLHGIAAEPVEQVSAELLPIRASGPPHFVRGHDTVNWMLHSPWVRRVAGSERASGYHFARLRRSFTYLPLEFRTPSDERQHFVLLSASDGGAATEVKVLDHALPTGASREVALALALREARAIRADAVVLTDALRPLVDTDPLLRRLAVRRRRRYLFRPADPADPLLRSLQQMRLSYVDGDVAFT